MVKSIEEQLKIYSILQMTTASISMLASLTLIFMIFRSHKKLSTPLHRLLLGLSISDFISSFALSFSSTLSPKDHIGWDASGNMTLCRTQAFIHFWSQNASPLYNCSLCIYYLIEIKYTSLQEYLAKIEISLHIIPVLIPLIFSITILSLDEFKPSLTSCYLVSVSPFECKFNPEVACDGEGLKDHRSIFLIWITHSMVIVPLTIFISMIMIYREVSAQEERSNQHRFSFSSRGVSSASRNTIAARNRALAYSSAWLLSWSTLLVSFLFRIFGLDGLLPFPLMLVHFAVYPSQGLFNFIVYIFPKLTKRMDQYKRECVDNPKRFMMAFRDSILSRGEESSRPRRRRSSVLSQNRALRSSSIPASNMQSPNSQECPTLCSGAGKLDASFNTNDVLQEEEEKDEDTEDGSKVPSNRVIDSIAVPEVDQNLS